MGTVKRVSWGKGKARAGLGGRMKIRVKTGLRGEKVRSWLGIES